MNNNNIGDTGAAALAKALESNSSLTSLDLHENNIEDTGAALVKALESNLSLTFLNLGSNQIGYTGVASFGKGSRIKFFSDFFKSTW